MGKGTAINNESELKDILHVLEGPDGTKVKDKCRKAIKPWIQKRKSQLTYSEFQSIWNSLVRDLYLADGVAQCRDLSIEMAKMTRPSVGLVTEDQYGAFLAAFLTAVQNEWGNFDRWRVDKFHTLIAITETEFLFHCLETHWKYKFVKDLVTALICVCPCLYLPESLEGEDVPAYFKTLKQKARRHPAKGMYLHMLQVFGRELKKQLGEAKLEITEDAKPAPKSKSTKKGKKSGAKKAETQEESRPARDESSRTSLDMSTFRILLALFAKILLSTHSDVACLHAVFEGCIDPLIEDGSVIADDSQQRVLHLLARLIFVICAGKGVPEVSRTEGMKRIEQIDEKHAAYISSVLSEKGLEEVNYDDLSEISFEREYPRTFKLDFPAGL